MSSSDLPAGRELDALVAEKVMGYTAGNCPHILEDKVTPPRSWSCKHCQENRGIGYHGYREHPFEPLDYSTDIAAAWEVVEKLRLDFELGWQPVDKELGWDASFGVLRGSESGSCVYAETAPLAICRAALKACGNSSEVLS